MTQRINAIDAARGFCLINIFTIHITFGVLREVSPSKIAFCDSAEIFVLLAGVSAFLVTGGRGSFYDAGAARTRMWRRAGTLYGANLAIIAASWLILLAAAPGVGAPNPTLAPPELIGSIGWSYAWDVFSMQQTIGYSMVLRLYIVLLLVAPLYLWLASKRFWYPLPLAGSIWLVSGHFGLADRNSLSGDLFALTLLPWQLVFAAGISLGAAIVRGVRLPRSGILVGAAALVVLGGTSLLVVGDQVSPEIHHWLETRNDRFWTGISKSYQSPLRLLYLLSLVYLFAALPKAPLIRLLHNVKPGNLLCRLGRRSLHVFAFGAVFAFALDQLLRTMAVAGIAAQGSAAAIVVELSLAALGLWLMVRISDRRLWPVRRSDTPTPGEPMVAAPGMA